LHNLPGTTIGQRTADHRTQRYYPPISIVEEMKTSYLDYAMPVIVARPCPTSATAPGRFTAAFCGPARKAATGPTGPTANARASSATRWAKHHPHGNQAIYDALARMTQDWSMRVP
jgi:DNA gyrase subunit A